MGKHELLTSEDFLYIEKMAGQPMFLLWGYNIVCSIVIVVIIAMSYFYYIESPDILLDGLDVETVMDFYLNGYKKILLSFAVWSYALVVINFLHCYHLQKNKVLIKKLMEEKRIRDM